MLWHGICIDPKSFIQYILQTTGPTVAVTPPLKEPSSSHKIESKIKIIDYSVSQLSVFTHANFLWLAPLSTEHKVAFSLSVRIYEPRFQHIEDCNKLRTLCDTSQPSFPLASSIDPPPLFVFTEHTIHRTKKGE